MSAAGEEALRRAKEGRAKQENPANAEVAPATGRSRIPLTVPRQKLEVPPIEGYHLHWFADRPGRVAQALQAGYEFVTDDEVSIVNTALADDLLKNGNSDLGSRVSVVGGAGEAGQPERLYLMKIKDEWWGEDQAELAKRNKSILDQIFRGVAPPGTPGDTSNRYVKTAKLTQS